ncbi:hypothetical protein TWF718_002486 [Orbilia javanica]|uniref:Uncharacterized protein n=1 Tax=Orbilia javanica TaxID=47235 RepID=A0AAN8RBG7_9PEZI
MSLNSKVAKIKDELCTVSNNLNSLETESKDNVDAELWVLQSALRKAATDTVHLITQSKKETDILLFQENDSITKSLITQLNVVIKSLNEVVASSDRVLQLGMIHVRKVEDFRNESLCTMRKSITATVTQVEHKKATATKELSVKLGEASRAAAELAKKLKRLETKEKELSSTRTKLSSKQREARRAERRQAMCKREAEECAKRAAAALEMADRLRKRAFWTTFVSFGLGIGFAIGDLYNAVELGTNASNYSNEARNRAASASQLRGECASVERQVASLESDRRLLESQKASLERRKEQNEKEIDDLQSSVTALNKEIASANALASDLASVNQKTQELTEKTRLLSRNLQQLKADISNCVENLMEQRDFGELTARKANRAYITDEKRLQILKSAGEVLPHIEQSQKMLPSVGPTAKAHQEKKPAKCRNTE